MAEINYDVIEHDGGWAYRFGDLISQRYPSRSAATLAGEQEAEAFRARYEVHDDDAPNASTQKADGFNR